jgi:predicted small lipoprotein YifL
MRNPLGFCLGLFTLFTLAACSTKTAIPSAEREAVRQQVEQQAKTAIERLVALNPELQQELDQAAGYFSSELSSFKVPVLGKSSGLGALYNKQNDSITYMDVERYDVGVGLGLSSYYIIGLFEDQ